VRALANVESANNAQKERMRTMDDQKYKVFYRLGGARDSVMRRKDCQGMKALVEFLSELEREGREIERVSKA